MCVCGGAGGDGGGGGAGVYYDDVMHLCACAHVYVCGGDGVVVMCV